MGSNWNKYPNVCLSWYGFEIPVSRLTAQETAHKAMALQTWWVSVKVNSNCVLFDWVSLFCALIKKIWTTLWFNYLAMGISQMYSFICLYVMRLYYFNFSWHFMALLRYCTHWLVWHWQFFKSKDHSLCVGVLWKMIAVLRNFHLFHMERQQLEIHKGNQIQLLAGDYRLEDTLLNNLGVYNKLLGFISVIKLSMYW